MSRPETADDEGDEAQMIYKGKFRGRLLLLRSSDSIVNVELERSRELTKNPILVDEVKYTRKASRWRRSSTETCIGMTSEEDGLIRVRSGKPGWKR